MTTSVIATLHQVVQINDVDSVQITDIMDDGTNSGTFIRAIRVFGEPLGESGPAIMEIQIKSQTRDNLDIITPTLKF